MGSLKVVGDPPVGGVIPQRCLEPLGGCAPFRGKPPDGHPIAGDEDGLAALDLVKDAREVSCGLCSRYRNHKYILSALI